MTQPFEFGNVVFPLTAQPTAGSLLAVCDPALAKLIDFLSFRINAYIATALRDVTGGKNPPIPITIRRALSVDPIANVTTTEQVAFPLFAVWRDRSKMSDRTLNWRQDVHDMGWAFMLPAMTLEQGEKYAHVLHAVVDIVNTSLRQGYDPAYNSGERIFLTTNISKAMCTEARYEPYKIADLTETRFYSVFGNLEVVEQQEPYTVGLSTFVGADLTVTQQVDDGAVLFATGTAPPIVTISGSLPYPQQLRVELQTTGPRGTATFRLSLDGGSTYVATGVTTAASYGVPGTSNTLLFPVGSYTNNNVYVSLPVTVVQASTDVG